MRIERLDRIVRRIKPKTENEKAILKIQQEIYSRPKLFIDKPSKKE